MQRTTKRLALHRGPMIRALGVLVGGSVPLAALAGGFQISEQNASGLGSAYAGQAALAEDASAIYFNPANLTRLAPKRQVVVAGSLVQVKSRFNDEGSCPPSLLVPAPGTSDCAVPPPADLGHTPGDDGGSHTDSGFVPNFYLAWPISPDLWLGLGVNAPFGLKNTRDEEWIGRFHAIDSEVKTININPTVAWRPAPNFSLGAGVNLQRMEATLSNAVSYRAVALASGNPLLIGAVPPGSEGVAKVEGDDWGFGWNVGLGVQLAPGLDLGLTYRSKIKYTLKGNASFSDVPAALAASVPHVADGEIEADIELPETASIALAWKVTPALTLMADYTRTGWDSVPELKVDRTDGPLAGQNLTTTLLELRDSWRAGIGAVFAINPAWSVRAGIATESAPVKDEFRTPRLPDEKRMLYGIGVGYQATPDVALHAGFMLVTSDTAKSELPNQDTATSAPRGSLIGNYDNDAKVFGVQVTVSF